jgi:hypothetical protein
MKPCFENSKPVNGATMRMKNEEHHLATTTTKHQTPNTNDAEYYDRDLTTTVCPLIPSILIIQSYSLQTHLKWGDMTTVTTTIHHPHHHRWTTSTTTSTGVKESGHPKNTRRAENDMSIRPKRRERNIGHNDASIPTLKPAAV